MMPPAPWLEYREIAEAMAQSFVDSLIVETGTEMQLGNPCSFDPSEMLGSKPAPIRAYVIHLDAPLRDVLVLFTSLGRDLIEPMLASGVRGALAAINIGSTDEQPNYTIDEVVEFESAERAIDQADALYLEAAYEIAMPLGDLRLVLGSGLLESATCFVNGVADQGASRGMAPENADIHDLELSEATTTAGFDEDLDAQDPAASIDFGDGARVAAAAANASLPAIDALDRELAEQEVRASAHIGNVHQNAAPNTLNPAGPDPLRAGHRQDTQRWASLLSGVEVELSAELGRTNLELGDITSLVEDRILTLDQMVDEPLTVFVNGTAYARARLVIVDDEYGIEIIDLIEQSSINGTNPIFAQIAA